MTSALSVISLPERCVGTQLFGSSDQIFQVVLDSAGPGRRHGKLGNVTERTLEGELVDARFLNRGAADRWKDALVTCSAVLEVKDEHRPTVLRKPNVASERV